jgi:hypothetical protein
MDLSRRDFLQIGAGAAAAAAIPVSLLPAHASPPPVLWFLAASPSRGEFLLHGRIGVRNQWAYAGYIEHARWIRVRELFRADDWLAPHMEEIRAQLFADAETVGGRLVQAENVGGIKFTGGLFELRRWFA